MIRSLTLTGSFEVAPARGRGLKSVRQRLADRGSRRPREGAWIEIQINLSKEGVQIGRPREGAWIEIG